MDGRDEMNRQMEEDGWKLRVSMTSDVFQGQIRAARISGLKEAAEIISDLLPGYLVFSLHKDPHGCTDAVVTAILARIAQLEKGE